MVKVAISRSEALRDRLEQPTGSVQLALANQETFEKFFQLVRYYDNFYEDLIIIILNYSVETERKLLCTRGFTY